MINDDNWLGTVLSYQFCNRSQVKLAVVICKAHGPLDIEYVLWPVRE